MDPADFDALTFDCYGTLIDWEAGIVAALQPWKKRCAVSADDETLLAAFAELEPAYEQRSPSLPYPHILAAVMAELSERYGQPAQAAEIEAFSQSVRDWPAFSDSPAALRRLKERFKLVIVSNVDRASFAHSNVKLGVDFDMIVTAEDVGSYKPELRNFEFALVRLQELGINRERVLHVAQSLFHDHVPAKSLGLKTVWVDRRAGRAGGATRPPAQSVQPDLVVGSLAELADYFDEFAAA